MASNVTEKEELNKMLVKAHKMLSDIQIPVAPLDMIQIRLDENKRKKTVALCVFDGDMFEITLHKNSEKEQPVDGEKWGAFSSVLHELLHTCKPEGQEEYGLFQHNRQFQDFAKKVRKEYGYDVMASFLQEDFANLHKPLLHQLYCPHCDSGSLFFSEETWSPIEAKLNNGSKFRCNYCGEYLQTK